MRALRQRGGVALLMLLVAIISVAGATIGPIYQHAARDSIVRDVLSTAPTTEQGVEISQNGPISGVVDGLQQQAFADLTAGHKGFIRGVFQPPIQVIEAPVTLADGTTQVPLAFRTDVCAHLDFSSGRCPTAKGQVAISTSLAASHHFAIGQHVRVPGWQHIRVTGVYNVPSAVQTYWYGRGSVYFPTEEQGAAATSANADAMFTPRETLEQQGGTVEGSSLVDLLLKVKTLRASDVDPLSASLGRLLNDQTIPQQQSTVESGIPSALATVHRSWSTLGVPVLVSTLELVILAWLLLFVVVSDTIEARGTEVALVKLRGFGTLRTLWFAVAQPTTLLILALPVGAGLGWLASRALSSVLLRAGTPVAMPAAGWVAAALATAGGLAAVLVASRRTIVRPVVDQWRRTASGTVRRGWVIDAIVVTGAVAGLVQMAAAGTIRSSAHGGVVLIAPALIGLAVAVPASRLLPIAARAAFGMTARRRGLAAFLAVRTVARRPGGARTTMTLATSFALVTFAIGAWSVGEHNRQRVADVKTGAAAVLQVTTPPHVDFATAVDRADPTGRNAAPVLTFTDGPSTLIASQPGRFVNVADWLPGSVTRPLATLPGLLHPNEPAPVALNGRLLRVKIDVGRLKPRSARLSADVAVPGADSSTPVPLGAIKTNHGTTLIGRLPLGCGCTLTDLVVESPEHLGIEPVDLFGQATIRDVSVRGSNGWQPLGITSSTNRWKTSGLAELNALSMSPGGLHWDFNADPSTGAVLSTIDRPALIPAVVAGPLLDSGGGGLGGVIGLDGRNIALREIARSAALPGAPVQGVLVDLTYAERAADSTALPATDEVWVTAAARAAVTRSLARQGIAVTSASTQHNAARSLDREGPGLASVLLLAAAAGGVLLASGGAVLSLAITGRRRRFEYIALGVEGVKVRTLRAAISLEQLIVFGYGALVGIGAGIVAITLSLKSAPEFVSKPVAPALVYAPQWGSLVLALAAALVVLVVAAVVSGLVLVRSLDPDQLREAPA